MRAHDPPHAYSSYCEESLSPICYSLDCSIGGPHVIPSFYTVKTEPNLVECRILNFYTWLLVLKQI